MHPMHVRGDHEPPQDAIDRRRHAHVAVIEHGGRIEQNLEGQYGLRRGTRDRNRGELDEHRQDHRREGHAGP